jgi:hypothetical protein
MKRLVEILDKLGACDSALDWLRGLPEATTLQEAWDLCDHGEWLLWLLVRWHPKDPNYHQFILRTARRALSKAPSLAQVIIDKEAWCQRASLKELEVPVVWANDPLWTSTWALVLDKLYRGPNWVQELKFWADDLRALFSRPEVREKKSKV